MDQEKYENNLKWMKIGGYLLGTGFCGLGIAAIAIERNIFPCVQNILLGRVSMLLLLGQANRMQRELDKEKHEADMKNLEEHDVGF